MFGIFNKKKKSDLEKSIEKDGIDHAAKRFSEIIIRKIPTREIAYQFVLEEIEAASKGNQIAINFAKNSGISPLTYTGASANSWSEVDGANGPQILILGICSQLISNTNLMVELRTKIADNVMRYFSLGKYKHEEISSINEENINIFTSPFKPTIEINLPYQHEENLRNYLLKLSKFNHSEICIEFSNVMSAKYHLMQRRASVNEIDDVQMLVTDLTDKALVICMFSFGQNAIENYCAGDSRIFNELVNKENDIVVNYNLEPKLHGELLLSMLSKHLNV